MTIIPFTKQGFKDLKKELESVISKRPDAVKELTRGRDMGDLSENGLYKAAKQNLIDIDRQIRHLKNLVKYGKPNTPLNNNYVQMGHTVTIETQNNKKEFILVGEYEVNPNENKISLKSPIGHNLMGRKIGNEIKITTPKGNFLYKIIAIN